MQHYLWHNLKLEKVAEILKTDLKNGLSQKEVELRFKKYGENGLPKEKPISRITIFLSQLKNPLTYILAASGTITIFLGHFTDSIVIFSAVIINSIIGYFQEYKASEALKKLHEILKIKAIVLREGMVEEIFQENLVVGDIVFLKTGKKTPADGRIIESMGLKTNEAVLTGEWMPVYKEKNVLKEELPLAERENMVFMGTIIEEGNGKMIVTATGKETEIGKIADLVEKTKEEQTPFQKKIGFFSKIIGIAAVSVGFLIFIFGITMGREPIEMLIITVALAVSSIPEGLPIVITVILAMGMQRILKKNGLVRRISSAETLGSASVIATDKTLTLTTGKMELKEIAGPNENLALKIAVLCNEAFIENADGKQSSWVLRGRPTDKALVLAGEKKGFRKVDLEKDFPKIEELSFNTKNKFIATFHKTNGKAFDGKENGGNELILVSGAPEKIIVLSSGGKELEKWKEKLEEMTKRGLRVVATAYKKIPLESDLKKEVNNLIFAGFIGLEDSLRPDVKKSIALCKKAGMKVIIVTGDHLFTTKFVAKELGIETERENCTEGSYLDKMSDEELEKNLRKINIFARVEPFHKLRIIRAWQKMGQVIAMTGDGINDAPALKAADIGVALGSGTDVAKEVSDLVLLDDNFSVIVAAIEEGRIIFDNVRKAIVYLFSNCFTEIIIVCLSLFFGLPLPILATQILWVNIIEDGPLGISLSFEPKEKDVMNQKPILKKDKILNKEMKVIIFIIGIITDIILFGLFLWLLKYSKYSIDHIRSVIFAGLTHDSLFYIFACKSLRKNIWNIKIFSNKFIIIGWLFGLLMLLTAIYVPFLQNLLHTVPLNIFDWQLILIMGLINLILIELTKFIFIKNKKT